MFTLKAFVLIDALYSPQETLHNSCLLGFQGHKLRSYNAKQLFWFLKEQLPDKRQESTRRTWSGLKNQICPEQRHKFSASISFSTWMLFRP